MSKNTTKVGIIEGPKRAHRARSLGASIDATSDVKAVKNFNG